MNALFSVVDGRSCYKGNSGAHAQQISFATRTKRGPPAGSATGTSLLRFRGLFDLLAVPVDRARGDEVHSPGVDVLPRHRLHVVGRHGGDGLAVVVQVVEAQPVPLDQQELPRDAGAGRRLEREVADQILPVVLDLGPGRLLVADAVQLFEELLFHELEVLRVGADVAGEDARLDVGGRGDVGVDRVGQPLAVAQAGR